MDFALISAELKRDEGGRLKLYTCPAGKLSIGVGRNLEDNGISADESAYLLRSDINRVCSELDKVFPWWRSLSEARQRAFVNMNFNLGLTRFSGFKKMLAAAQARDYETAAKEMLNSKWHSDVGSRADRLAKMMEDGE